jgi:RNA polymerase sigma-70 factor (sigma-E family)
VDSSDTKAPSGSAPDVTRQVTALYHEHSLGLVRLAFIMLGDTGSAEDVVQEAFLGLYRRWGGLSDTDNALTYVRSSVLNGCRTLLRRQSRRDRVVLAEPDMESAEARALLDEEHREVLAAIRRLPDRQREAVVLRFYLELPEDRVAEVMQVSRGTVKSATSRGVAAVGRMLKEGAGE